VRLLFAPKAAKEAVWEPAYATGCPTPLAALRDWLPNIGGVGGGADFSNLTTFSHTDVGRKGDFPERFRRITELADAVIFDKAHQFRNPRRRNEGEDQGDPSRCYQLYDLLDDAERKRGCSCSRRRRSMTDFARTPGINNLRSHFNNMEKALRATVGADSVDLSEHLTEAQDVESPRNGGRGGRRRRQGRRSGRRSATRSCPRSSPARRWAGRR
jgi:hypothetical protein